MRFRLRQFRGAMRRAGAWWLLFGRTFRHAVTRRAVLISLMALTAGGLYSRYVTDFNFFVIIEQGAVTVHKTYAKDAETALAEAGIYIGQYDRVSLPGGQMSGSAAEIVLDRDRVVYVDVTLDGVTVPITSRGGTVGDALDKAGYVPRPLDIVSHPYDLPAQEGMRIVVTRIDVYSEYEYTAVPYEETVNENPYLNYGTEVVIEEGVEGEITTEYLVTLRDGEMIARQPVGETLTREPEARVVELGTGGAIKTPDGTYLRYKKKMEVICTAYTTERQVSKTNAIGNIARRGTIAVDPKVIPLRSKVYVAAKNNSWVYGVAICEDTGGVIKGNIIDLYFDTYEECINFGRQSAYLYILE